MGATQADPMETANTCFHRTAWSATGDIHGVCSLHTLHHEEENSQSQNTASNINQPVPAHATGRSVSHAVESDRPASSTWQVTRCISVPLGNLGWRPTSYYCLGWPCMCDVNHCECGEQGKTCNTDVCGCHEDYVLCISYSNCFEEDGCCNLYTNIEEA